MITSNQRIFSTPHYTDRSDLLDELSSMEGRTINGYVVEEVLNRPIVLQDEKGRFFSIVHAKVRVLVDEAIPELERQS